MKIFSFKLFKRYFFLALLFQILLGMILISGMVVGGEFSRSTSYNTFFIGDLRNIERQTLGSPYTKLSIRWDYELNDTNIVLIPDNIMQNILDIPLIGYHELTIDLYTNNQSNLPFSILSPDLYRRERGYNPENAIIAESTKNYLDMINSSLIDPNEFPFLSKSVVPVVSSEINQETPIFLSTDYVNLSKIFSFNHSTTLNIWYSSPDREFMSITELNLYINQLNEDIESKIKLFLFPVQTSIKNSEFISLDQIFFDLIVDWYSLKIIDKFFQYLWFYFVLIFICTLIILLIFLKNQSSHLALLLIRGMTLQDIKIRILVNIIFGLSLGNLIAFIILIFLPDELTFFSISTLVFSLLLTQVIFSLALIFSFIMLMQIFSSFYVNPEEEPVIHSDENIFQIAKIKYKTIFTNISNYRISFPKYFYLLLGTTFLLLILIHLAEFLFFIPLNSFFTVKNLLFILLGLQFLVIGIFFIENLLLLFLNLKKDFLWISSLSHILRKLQSNRQLILVALLILTLMFQAGTAFNSFKRDELFSNLQKSGDIIFTPLSEENNTQIYQNLSIMEHVQDYYGIYQFESIINENSSFINTGLTIITNETSFYSMRPYVEGVLDQKHNWEKFLLQSEGILLYKDLSEKFGLKVGDAITISIPILSLSLSAPILSIYHAGIRPLYTGIIITESLLEKQLLLKGLDPLSFEKALNNNTWSEYPYFNLNIRHFYLSIDNDNNIFSVVNKFHQLYRLGYDKTEYKVLGEIDVITEKQWLPFEYKTYEEFFLIEMFPLLIGVIFTLFLLFLVIIITLIAIIRDNKTYLRLLTLRGISYYSIRNYLVGIQFIKFFLVSLSSTILSYGIISVMQSARYLSGNPRMEISRGTIPQFYIFSFNDWGVILVILGLIALLTSFIQYLVIRKNRFEPLLDSAM
ncbi:MAG: hypothetical protein HeimC3_02470 [Candidatus Heimdallarchaeota archaeon LC_3]|nr:MAG: hypothetical protein HeimC3_49500 [Candidatus Heimdallarchaeota archaeon LC_3]OLS27670.1 MAG: hypothetical protein HeimC3_02470 [Candidatus Heimdallarchaeota archaeon LC_3]